MEKPSNPKTPAADALMHPKEVAAFLRVSLSWLAKSRLNGTGPPFIKVGRAVRYLRSAVMEFVRAKTQTSTSAT
jgi:predicted DNA-binding transcriptional regulator AlpA